MGRAQVPRMSIEAYCAQEDTLRNICLINCMFKLYRFKDYPYIILHTCHPTYFVSLGTFRKVNF